MAAVCRAGGDLSRIRRSRCGAPPGVGRTGATAGRGPASGRARRAGRGRRADGARAVPAAGARDRGAPRAGTVPVAARGAGSGRCRVRPEPVSTKVAG
ncbi:hypothetical protein GCM10010215_05710 [Streptomyces virginiae]|uniref:Uncharacterized protein n=1 Tax=Streptomyces virginiae TaxID=1961 RepID=A0ABQ3NLJ3_STRVG|nr:hypothetical protein GCM10010215_05710 [Streptomyces virginiae]GHI13632.1 hypothetical protein Scinn_30950 [Streptomyces virginiae]GLV93156.1 hypothetical protein Slala04_46100 [Streptomyces lavendulae subsp. lavendulae]